MKISKDDIRTDKTIIIGFVGPIGSGCTTVSNFMDERSFFPFLKSINLIDNVQNTETNDNVLDGKIESLLKRKEGLIQSSSLVGKTNFLEEQLKEKHSELKERLERRQYSYSLNYYLKNKHYRKRLRISCSSLIVFDLVRKLGTISNAEKRKEDNVRKVKEIISKSLKKFDCNINNFKEVYKEVKSFHSHKNSISNQGYRNLQNCFKHIKEIKKALKKSKYYRDLLQDFGDNIRSFGNPYIYINTEWIKKNKKYFMYNNLRIARYIEYIVHYVTNNDKDLNLYIIDSFRNQVSIKYLRNRYSRFYLVSIYASRDERIKRLKIKNKKMLGRDFNEATFETNFVNWDNRDQGLDINEDLESLYKQNVNEVVRLSDIAINNHKLNKDGVFKKFLRYLALIVDPGCTKPTTDEMFMNMAYTMAMKSNCISRQVGAVIEGKNGYVVGAGWNDVGVGQISCGLRNIKDLKYGEFSSYLQAIKSKSGSKELTEEQIIKDLIIKYGGEHCCFCFKDEISKYESAKKIKPFVTEFFNNKISCSATYSEVKNGEALFAQIKDDFLRSVEKKTILKRLEFCKALHAEENAIIQSARIGGMGLIGSTIYSTTFPCELCAKKIQQSGIAKVIYVDPYPESLSEEIYLHDGVKRVVTEQFEGVKPFAYIKLFNPNINLKERQNLLKGGYIES